MADYTRRRTKGGESISVRSTRTNEHNSTKGNIVNFQRTISALENHGKASSELAVALSQDWKRGEDGKRAKAFFTEKMSPVIKAAGHELSYDSARVYVSVVDTLGDQFTAIVTQYGWSQANEAARRNTGNLTGAKNLLEIANRDENGEALPGKATVTQVKATARDLAAADGKKSAKAKKSLTVANLTQAEIRAHDVDAVSAYRAKLAEQLKRADNVLRAKMGKSEAVAA
jgi:hypothetical protein